MKTTLKKIVKGTLVIFAIKLILIGVLFIGQSCETDNEILHQNEEANTNFIESLRHSKEKLQVISVRNSKINIKNNSSYLERDMQGVSVSYCLNEINDDSITIEELVEDINNVTSFIQAKSQYGFGDLSEFNSTLDDPTNSDQAETPEFNPEDCLAIFNLPLQPIVDAIEPTIEDAKNYLRSKGLTDNDIENLLAADSTGGAIEEYNLVPTVMMLIAEEQNTNSNVGVNFQSLFGSSAFASQVGECAGDALGISAIAEVMRRGINTSAGKALLKKAIRKVASRALGWIGAAIFIYEFGDCMNWW
ncbi:hypothetical protein A9Q87_09770 [Flavobacteriales bacterium 34_180_T64]|nr:hypothetical protein A9Q87_09770 [Flavobacteriales bacterium 34_180_T64]